MCMSRLHLVVRPPDKGSVRVRDLDGHERCLSLLAYDGPPPEVGDWLVAQSGFALALADPNEAAATVSELAALRTLAPLGTGEAR